MSPASDRGPRNKVARLHNLRWQLIAEPAQIDFRRVEVDGALWVVHLLDQVVNNGLGHQDCGETLDPTSDATTRAD